MKKLIKSKYLIIFILLLGLILRLVSLNQSFWLDEATSGIVARDMSFSQILNEFSPGDFHPPLYYLLLKVWGSIFGTSEIALRSMSVVFGMWTVYLVYLIGKEISNKKIGLLGAAFIATSGLHVYYSQEARMYVLSTFLVTALVYLFLRIIKKGKSWEWLAFSVLLAVNSVVDYLPNLIIPVLWLCAYSAKKKKGWWKRFATAHISLMAPLILWMPTFLVQLKSGLGVESGVPGWWGILGKTTLKEMVLIPTKFIFGRISIVNKTLYAIVAGAVGLVYAAIIIRKPKKQFYKKSPYLILWMWLMIPIVLAALLGFKISVFSYFRLIFVLPAFSLLLASGISRLDKKWGQKAIVFVLVVNLLSTGAYLFNTRFHREDWRGLVGYIESESVGKRAKVIFVANSQMEGYNYYLKDRNPTWKVSSYPPDALDRKSNIIWLMRYVQDIFDPEDNVRQTVEKYRYVKTREHDFNGIVVWRYDK